MAGAHGEGMDELALLLHDHAGVLTSTGARLARRLSRWCAAGRLERVLRGVYVAPSGDIFTLIRAVAAAYPDAIFTGKTAAWLNGWSDVRPQVITAIHRGRSRSTGRVRLTHGSLSDTQWTELSLPGGSLRVMTLPMAAVDLITDVGAKIIDRFMREARNTAAALTSLHAALAATPGRRGNVHRRRVLDRTNTNPWSGGERALHDLLDDAGITGWRANVRLVLEDSSRWVIPDILFLEAGLILEFDSWTHHGDREAFERDRHRSNRLVLAGWRILHITHRMLSDPRGLARLIRAALAERPATRPRGIFLEAIG